MSKPPQALYTINWVDDDFGIDPDDGNVDVLVDFSTGQRFTATFFTPANIQSLLDNYRETGECAGGLYVWASHMIVVTRVTRQNVEQVVADLLASGEFAKAFEGPFEIPKE